MDASQFSERSPGILFISPFLRVASLPAPLGVTYPTAKADCKRLVEAGILEPLPNVSPTTYYSSDIFNVAYKGIGDEPM